MAEGEIIAICFHNSELNDSEGESDRYDSNRTIKEGRAEGERAIETTEAETAERRTVTRTTTEKETETAK